jgi:hypothetical protein
VELRAASYSTNGRSVLLGEADSVGALAAELAPPNDSFILLLAVDATREASPQLVAAAERLLSRGARYVCVWGPDCERLHDCFDEAAAIAFSEPTGDDVIMTTWHADERLDQAIWFALNSAFPTPAYSKAADTVLIVSVANPAWAAEASEYVATGAPLRG